MVQGKFSASCVTLNSIMRFVLRDINETNYPIRESLREREAALFIWSFSSASRLINAVVVDVILQSLSILI